MRPAVSSSTGVSITNPLVLYRALIATKRIDADPAQHRLAIHLQKLYERLKDYEPVIQYGHRLQEISRTLGSTPGKPAPGTGHDAPKQGILSTMFEKRRKENEGLALTRVLTSQEAAMELDSPKGLMLHGEVGTGKSMLIDLFADCLPNRKKKRWHYTTFMLETIGKLEQLRRSRQLVIPSSLGQQDDYSLLWLARDMISTSPILFLDEFQLPDRAAAKIITNLMTCFFHLGGVLIATSNRIPEELAKAAGMDFSQPAPSRMDSLGWSFGLGKKSAGGKSEAMFSSKSEFAAFLDVLKARCEVWEMEGSKDYRRREAELDAASAVEKDATSSGTDEAKGFAGLQNMQTGNVGLGWEQSTSAQSEEDAKKSSTVTLPRHYFLDAGDASTALEVTLKTATATPPSQQIPWAPATLQVYGRQVQVPRAHNGVTSWTFDELCSTALGPADYITLASTFHTLALTNVPVLSLLQKNEARRLITLLDALYEARCKLVISAAAGPDDLFFPETKAQRPSSDGKETVDQDAVYSETLSEIYQDATAPFRPNIAAYADENHPSAAAPTEPDATHARFAGLFSRDAAYTPKSTNPADQLEDTPPNMPPGTTASLDTGDVILFGRAPRSRGPDFQRAAAYTGEDERFAYKRARSRLWEMCGTRWWERGADGDEADWHRPIAAEVRAWERSRGEERAAAALTSASAMGPGGERAIEGAGEARSIRPDADEVLFRHGASPFRTAREAPPKFGWTHAWGMMRWGKKAGRWGEGVEAFDKERRGDEGQREDETAEEYVRRREEWRRREPGGPGRGEDDKGRG